MMYDKEEKFLLKHIFKGWPQPGSLRNDFSGPVIKYSPLSFQVAKEKAAASEVNKSTTSCDTGGMALEEAAPEKPESRSGSLSSRAGATHQEEQSAKRCALFLCCASLGPDG